MSFSTRSNVCSFSGTVPIDCLLFTFVWAILSLLYVSQNFLLKSEHFLFSFLLRCSWHTILCPFQVYNTVIWHLYRLWNDHNKSVPIQSYYTIIDHIPYAVYYIPVAKYFITIASQTPIPSLLYPCPPRPLATTSLFSISVSLFLFCRYVDLCQILDSKWYNMVFVFLFLTYFA